MRLSFYERASCFFLLLLITVGCKKNGDSNQTTYGFGNATGSPVTLDIYGSNADYVTNANALYRYKLDKGGYKDVLLTNGNSYYFDWYTDDYRYNNWSIFYGLDSSYYKIIGGDDPSSFSLGSDYEDGEDTVRSVLLNGNGISSTWSGVAVGLGTTGNSLDSVNGTHQFIFYKDKSCVHMLQGKYGTINDTMRYVIQFYSSGSMGTRNPSVCTSYRTPKSRRYQL